MHPSAPAWLTASSIEQLHSLLKPECGLQHDDFGPADEGSLLCSNAVQTLVTAARDAVAAAVA